MKKQRIQTTVPLAFALFMFALAGSLLLHAQKAPTKKDAAPLLQSILIAHRAWITPPGSIRIQGTSMRGASQTPVTITATRKEEIVLEYGFSKRVSTPSSLFEEDGQKTAFANTPGAFDQLDITGIFLISQLIQRNVQARTPESVASQDGRLTKIHLSTERMQIHFRQISVTDELDVAVSPSGLLAEIERTIYLADSRLRYTKGFRFSDYRDTGGVLLPYRIDTVFKGNIEETILVNNYQVDVPTAPSLFEPRFQSRSAR